MESPLYPQHFRAAARSLLEFLERRFPMSLWMITRVEGDDWIVIDAQDKFYNIQSGDVFCWSDSYCSRMVMGEGPQVAVDAQSVPAYAQAEINKIAKIASYVGAPIQTPDGAFFGTLCAIDPNPQAHLAHVEIAFVTQMVKMLTFTLQSEMAHQVTRGKLESANRDAA